MSIPEWIRPCPRKVTDGKLNAKQPTVMTLTSCKVKSFTSNEEQSHATVKKEFSFSFITTKFGGKIGGWKNRCKKVAIRNEKKQNDICFSSHASMRFPVTWSANMAKFSFHWDPTKYIIQICRWRQQRQQKHCLKSQRRLLCCEGLQKRRHLDSIKNSFQQENAKLSDSQRNY